VIRSIPSSRGKGLPSRRAWSPSTGPCGGRPHRSGRNAPCQRGHRPSR
jgi:hypothetical protein